MTTEQRHQAAMRARAHGFDPIAFLDAVQEWVELTGDQWATSAATVENQWLQAGVPSVDRRRFELITGELHAGSIEYGSAGGPKPLTLAEASAAAFVGVIAGILVAGGLAFAWLIVETIGFRELVAVFGLAGALGVVILAARRPQDWRTP